MSFLRPSTAWWRNVLQLTGACRAPAVAIAFALSVAACGGGGSPDDGGAGKGGTVGGDAGSGGSGGDGGTGGVAGEGGTGGNGGTAGDGGTGGEGGTGGDGGTGGTGGSQPGLCEVDEDCAGFAQAQCTVAVCNDGGFEGPVGVCVVVAAEAGTSCDDGLFCTVEDACNEAGECVGGAPNDCGLEGSECAAVACDERLGQCRLDWLEDGTACEAGSLCDEAVCQAGSCVERPKDCSAETTACTVGVCDPEDGSCMAEPLEAGFTCSIGDLGQCAVAACDGKGACMPVNVDAGSPCSIPGLGQCEVAACDGAGSCEASPASAGSTCSIPGLGQCEVAACDGAGSCEASPIPAGTSCSIPGLGSCQVAACDGSGACGASALADGTACDDFNGCTVADACAAGACVGTLDEPACLAAAVLHTEGFEDCTAAGWTLTGEWQCGTPTTVGPETARTGSGCLATNLSGNYSSNISFPGMTAISPTLDLSTASAPVLEFWAWFDTEANNDGITLKARRDGEQTFVGLPAIEPPHTQVLDGEPAWTGKLAAEGWKKYAVSLGDYAGELIQVQFAFRSDSSVVGAGVYIDDLRIVEDYLLPIELLRSDLPEASVNVPFSATAWGKGPASMTWSIVDGANHGWLQIDPVTGVLSGTPAGEGAYSVTVRAESTILPSNFAEKTLSGRVGADPGTILHDGLETSCGDWSLAGDWECGTPLQSVGPFDGVNSLGTRLGANYTHGQGWGSTNADSPAFDLSAFDHPMLRFRAFVQTEACCDGFNLGVSTDGGANFALLTDVSPVYNGTADGQPVWSGDQSAAGWRTILVDLGAHTGQVVNLRFAFRSDGGVNGEGIFLDDFTFIEASGVPLAITSAGLPNAFAGTSFLADLERSGGSHGAVWSVTGGTNHGWLAIEPSTGRLTGTPGAGDLGPVAVTVRVEEPNRPSNFAEATLGLEVIQPVPGVYLDEDFSSCSRGWAFGGPWECGTPTDVGPADCSSGAGCVATVLDGNYPNSIAFGSAGLDSPTIDLTGATEPKLWFGAWVYTESCCDGFNVKASTDGGQTWTRLTDVTPAYTGTVDSQPSWSGNLSALGWRRYVVDLGSLAGSVAKLRFDFRSDGGGANPGVYIDDVLVAESFADPLIVTTATRLPDAFAGRAYSMRLSKSGGTADAGWSIVSGPSWLQIDAATGVLSGTPGPGDLGSADLTVRIEEPLNPINAAEADFTIQVTALQPGEHFAEAFDVCSGWTLAGDWACGVTSGTTGPSACRSGNCIATKLTGDYSNGQAYETTTADSPWIDLSGATLPRLVFWAWVKTASNDGFNVKVTTDGTNYSELGGVAPEYTGIVDGQSAWTGDLSGFGWRRYHVDLLPYVDQSIRVRFAFRSDSSSVSPGVYVDDLRVIEGAFDPLTIASLADLGDAMTGMPFTARLVKNLGSDAAVWTLVSGPSWLQLDSDGLLHGTPGIGDIGRSTLSVHVEEPANPGNSGDREFSLRVIDGSDGWHHASNFEDCRSSGWALTGEWECGTPDVQVGPGACKTGGACIATRLNGNYANGVAFGTANADSPAIDLTDAVEPVATFWAWVKTETNWDGFNVQVSDDGGQTFQPVTGVSPAYPGNVDSQPSWSGTFDWRQYEVPLQAWAGGPITLRFAFRSDSGTNGPGVYIDDFRVTESFANPVAITTIGLPSGIVGLPWSETLAKSGGTAAGASWSIVSGPGWITLDPATGVLAGTPTVAEEGMITIRVEDGGRSSNFDERTFTFQMVPAPTAPEYVADFSAAGGWILAGQWERGMPTSGPGSCKSAGPCIATKLAGNYDGNASFATSVATSPTIDLSAAARSTLHFWAWLHSENNYDGFHLLVSADGGATFNRVTTVSPAYTGNVDGVPSWSGDRSADGWSPYQADLSAYDGQQILVRFAFRSDNGSSYPGVYIDQLQVSTAGLAPLTLHGGLLPPTLAVGSGIEVTFTKKGGTSASTWTYTPGPNAGWLQFDPATHTLSGAPTLADLGRTSLTIRVDEPGYPSNYVERSYSIDVVDLGQGVSFAENFDSGAGGWTLSGDWEHGSPSNVGPATCHSGSACLGTVLDGNASMSMAVTNNYAESPVVFVPAGGNPVLTWWAWQSTHNGRYFGYTVRIRKVVETAFTRPAAAKVSPAYSGNYGSEDTWAGDMSQMGWVRYSADLSEWAGQAVVVRFTLGTGGTGTEAGPGVYVDDVMIQDASIVAPAIVADSPVRDAFVNVPYTHRLQKTGGGTATWSIVGGSNHSWLAIDPDTGALTGIPSSGEAGDVSVVVRVEDVSDPSLADEVELTFSIDGAQVYYATDFEDPCAGNGWAFAGDWQCGTPLASYADGPADSFSGDQCVATNLSGTYSSSQTWAGSHATSPQIDLTGATHPVLWFRMFIATEGHTYDGVNLSITTDGTTYQSVTAVTPAYSPAQVGGRGAWAGTHSGAGWRLFRVDLSSYVGETVRLRFALQSDGSGDYAGAYVDEVVVVED